MKKYNKMALVSDRNYMKFNYYVNAQLNIYHKRKNELIVEGMDEKKASSIAFNEILNGKFKKEIIIEIDKVRTRERKKILALATKIREEG